MIFMKQAARYFDQFKATKNPQDLKKGLDILYSLPDCPDAQYSLALHFQHDTKKSVQYMLSAASKNHPRALYQVAMFYRTGILGPDPQKSFEYMRLSKIPMAAFMLGDFYYSGYGVTKNLQKAQEYYTIAAKADIPRAKFALGCMLLNNDPTANQQILGVEYLLGAQNEPNASFILAEIYTKGLTYVPKNTLKAKTFIQKALKTSTPTQKIKLEEMMNMLNSEPTCSIL
jgi:TPR repeat protein